MIRLAAVPMFLFLFGAAFAQEDPVHAELRKLKEEVTAAINAGDFDKSLTYLHPNCVVTWQNAEVSRGRDGVKAYNDRMTKGDKKVVESFKVELGVDELSILYGGDTAMAWGPSTETFKLTDGSNFTVKGRWSATLVKVDGKWLVANLHSSSNLFDNPMVAAMKDKMSFVGGIGIVGGLIIGALGVILVKRAMPKKPV